MFDLGFPREWSTLKKLLWLKITQAASAVIRLVTGSAPLTLTNAVSRAIHSLTQYGLCTQASTPTPDSPVDIMCNNGVVGMVDDELPSGYTRLSYIESDGTSGSSGSNGYVDTGIFINSIDTDVEIDFQLTDTYAPSPRMAWGYMGTPSSLPRWGLGAYSSKWLGSPNATASVGAVDADRHVAVMRVYLDDSNAAFYDGTLDGETLYNVNNLGNVSIFEDNDKWSVYLFARNNNNTAANFAACKIFRFKVYKAGALTHDLVPCKDGNGVLGFYDLVTATFNVASGTLIAGAADYSHSRIVADGAPEVLTVKGINLFDKNTMDTGQGYYVNNSGNIVNGYNANRTVWIPCKPNTKYSYWHTEGAGGCRAFAMNKDTIDTSDSSEWLKGSPASLGKNVVSTVTTPADAVKLYITAARSNLDPERSFDEQLADFMVVEGEVAEATAYEPYVQPQTASVPMLLSVGDYADEAEIINGIKTGKVGVYVFTGEEAFTKGSAFYTTNTSFLPSKEGSITPICTHFKGISSSASRVADSLTMTVNGPSGSFTGCVYFYADRSLYATAADFKAWLASEYANGTPVIVLYPLATEQTEQATPHALHTSAGDNVVSVTSNVDPVELAAEYFASA